MFLLVHICSPRLVAAANEVQNVTSKGPHIRIGTFITGKTDQWILDSIRANLRKYNSLPKHDGSCVIRNTFFVGRTATKGHFHQDVLESPQHNDNNITSDADILQLDFVENMNNGKSLVWFENAVKRYHKADFYIKADTDTVVDYDKLCTALSDANPARNVYFGMSYGCVRVCHTFC